MLNKVQIAKLSAVRIESETIIFNGKSFCFGNDSPLKTLLTSVTDTEAKQIQEYAKLKHGSLSSWESELLKTRRDSVFSTSFVQVLTPHGTEIYYRSGNDVERLTNTSEKNFEDQIIKCLQFVIKDKRAANLNRWQLIEEITQAIAFNIIPVTPSITKITNHKNKYGLAYFNLDSLKECNTPAWDSFCSQFKTPIDVSLFKAWCYSIYVSGNRSRQVLWITGKGKSGKSCVTNTIHNSLYSRNKKLSVSLDGKFSKDKYSTSSYRDSILVTVSDCKELNLINREDVKNLTGGDVVSTRTMYNTRVTSAIYSKILVTSNRRPYINTCNAHETSRIIHLELDSNKIDQAKENWSKDMDFQTCLDEELFGFLAKCKEHYLSNLSNDGHNFTIPDTMMEEFDFAAFSPLRKDIDAFWSEHIEESKGSFIVVEEVVSAFTKFIGGREKKTYSWFIKRKISDMNLVTNPLGVGSAGFVLGFKMKENIRTRKELIEEFKNANKQD